MTQSKYFIKKGQQQQREQQQQQQQRRDVVHCAQQGPAGWGWDMKLTSSTWSFDPK
jgi:hypothetical protein